MYFEEEVLVVPPHLRVKPKISIKKRNMDGHPDIRSSKCCIKLQAKYEPRWVRWGPVGGGLGATTTIHDVYPPAFVGWTSCCKQFFATNFLNNVD